MSSKLDITQLLQDWSNGDQEALGKLMPLVYSELRQLAHHYMQGERRDHTLQTTALVHEAYLRLVDHSKANWKNRAHFFGVSAQLMRQILIDHARSHAAGKRGGGVPRLSLDEAKVLAEVQSRELIALDDALKSLAAIDPQKSHIVELRFFGGLSVNEVAEFLKISVPTVVRHWRTARAWLYREMSSSADGSPQAED
jgi:RNA polymerase sigma factor (TIGR02999 family)